MYQISLEFINNNIPLWFFPSNPQLGIMHHKFILFGNQNGHPLLWTGSFNFTEKANTRNAENVIILGSQNLIHQYQAQFEQLKQYSSKQLPILLEISCPTCGDESLRINNLGTNKTIYCTQCPFNHPYIGK